MEARHLKNLIDSRGIKQKFIASKLNVSNALITQWVKGTKVIPENRVQSIKRLFA